MRGDRTLNQVVAVGQKDGTISVYRPGRGRVEETIATVLEDAVAADLPAHGASQHDNTTKTVSLHVRGHTNAGTAVQPTWNDGATNVISVGFTIPADYVAGTTIAVKLGRRGAATGTAVMTRNAFQLRDATALNQFETAVAMNFAPGNTNTNVLSMTLNIVGMAAGDYIRYDITRAGADGSDDMASTVNFDGCAAEYTANGA